MQKLPSNKTPEEISRLDKHDPLAHLRSEFKLSPDKIYLNGNSLGPLMHRVSKRINAATNEWGEDLISCWNKYNWMDLPFVVGDMIGEIIGANRGSVVACDNTSINLFKALSAAISLKPGRQNIITDSNNFPTDLYIAQGVLNYYPEKKLKIISPKSILKHLNNDVAVLMLTHVDYKNSQCYDMKAITQCAREHGIITIWDLSHSAGAVELNIAKCGIDFAVGCGYKYLNGGPGAPAYIYAAPIHSRKIKPILSGWMGHKKPFSFEVGYRPASGISRFMVGTPSIIPLSSLQSALSIWSEFNHSDIWRKSQLLSQLFIKNLIHKKTLNLNLISPSDAKKRGSHIGITHHMAFEISQALIDHGVIVDFRAPNIVRVAFSPLYNSYKDIYKAAKIFEYIIKSKIYTKRKYSQKKAVT